MSDHGNVSHKLLDMKADNKIKVNKLKDNTDFCKKISQTEYIEQSKNYTMEKLKELQGQLIDNDKNKKEKSKIYDNLDVDSYVESDDNCEEHSSDDNGDNDNNDDIDENNDADCDTINININNLTKSTSKSNKFKSKSNSKSKSKSDDEKEIIILNLIKKREQDVKRMKLYSNKIKQLNDEIDNTDAKLHYLKLDYNNLELVADSLKKEIKEKASKINYYENQVFEMRWKIIIFQILTFFMFITNIYIYFS